MWSIANVMKMIPNSMARFLVLSISMNSENLLLEKEKYSDKNRSIKNMKAKTNPISRMVRGI